MSDSQGNQPRVSDEPAIAARLSGRTALVTGGASGLGLAIARRLTQEGARVALADLDEAGAKAAAAKLPGAIAVALDVRDEAAWVAALDEVEVAFGGLSILVNNAGIGDMGSIEEMPVEGLRRMHAINVEGVWLGCQKALPLLRGSPPAAIVNMSSVAALVAAGNMAAYNATKAAVGHLTKSVALHCAHRGDDITVNSVHPAFVRTPLLKPLEDVYGEAIYDKLARQIPIGRLGEPAEVAGAVAFLVGPDARFMTGSQLVLDGGLSVG